MNRFDSLWIDVHLATMTNNGSAYGALRNAAIGVTDGKISWIGKSSDVTNDSKKNSKVVYDGAGRWITPGLIDCHTHLIFGGNRISEFEMKKNGVSYEKIAAEGGGIRSTVQATRNATKEELLTSAKHRVLQLLKEGVTTIEIKSGYGLDLETEITLLQIATELQKQFPLTIQRTFLGAHTIPPEYAGKPDAYIDFICQTVLPIIKKQNLADVVDAFCETVAFTPQQIEKLFDAAKQLGFSVKLHAEQLSDQKGTILALRHNALSVDHLEYISEESIQKLAKTKTIAVLLPGASYYLQEQKKPPVELLRKYHVPMAVATDLNPGTAPINSLLAVVNMACILFGFTPEEALQGVTRHAASALGMQNALGTLELNKHADFVVWDIDQPAELAYGIGLNPEKIVIRNGEIIYKSHEHYSKPSSL